MVVGCWVDEVIKSLQLVQELKLNIERKLGLSVIYYDMIVRYAELQWKTSREEGMNDLTSSTLHLGSALLNCYR